MNKKLHSVPPAPNYIGNLDIPYGAENTSSCFLFEPKKLVPFETAWEWQRISQKNLMEKRFYPASVWLLQHTPCFTLGRGSQIQNLFFNENSPPFPLYRIERGGEVTCHLPGQLVGYLVIDLHRYQTDLNWYLRKLEQVLIDVLFQLDLPGERLPGLTGVWCNGYKVGSIGIACKKWVTQHGFSLNVDCDLSGFNEIIPCGLKKVKIGKLNDWIPELKVKDVQPIIRESIKNHFSFQWKVKDTSCL